LWVHQYSCCKWELISWAFSDTANREEISNMKCRFQYDFYLFINWRCERKSIKPCHCTGLQFRKIIFEWRVVMTINEAYEVAKKLFGKGISELGCFAYLLGSVFLLLYNLRSICLIKRMNVSVIGSTLAFSVTAS
jgi:hypothetical protein